MISLQAREKEEQHCKSRKELHQQANVVRVCEEQKPMFRHNSAAALVGVE